HLFLIDLIVRTASALKSRFGPFATISVIEPSLSTTNVISALIEPSSPSITPVSKEFETFCLNADKPPGNSAAWSTVSYTSVVLTFGASIVAALVPVDGGGGGGV